MSSIDEQAAARNRHIERLETETVQSVSARTVFGERCTGFISSRTQPLFRSFFQWLGRLIYDHHFWFLAAGLLLTVLCLIGASSYYVLLCTTSDSECTEHRSRYLWIPRESTVWSQFTEMIELFGSYSSIMSLLLTATNDDNSVLTPSALDAAYDIYNEIDDISFNNDADQYEDLCLRSAPLQPFCDSVANSVFGVLFGQNPMLWANESSTLDIINSGVPSTFFLGGLDYDESGEIRRATSMRVFYELIGSTNQTVWCMYNTQKRTVAPTSRSRTGRMRTRPPFRNTGSNIKIIIPTRCLWRTIRRDRLTTRSTEWCLVTPPSS